MKKKLIIAGILLVLAGLIYGGIQWKRIRDEKIEEQLLLIEYRRQNRAFGMNMQAEYSGYHGYEEVDEEWLYVALAAYKDYNLRYDMERQEITIEDVKEYLSSEYNEDGSLRVYSKAENIGEYVYWWSEDASDAVNGYWIKMEEMAREYQMQHPELVVQLAANMNTKQLQELINKYNDPDYEINVDIMGEIK